MFEIKGKYNTAFVYAKEIEQETYSQIMTFLNNENFKNGRIAIMPDTHSGKGAVIGFTHQLQNSVVPNVIGVDIGCSVISWKLGKVIDIGTDFKKLDDYIRNNIPSGRSIHNKHIKKEILEDIWNSVPEFRESFNVFIADLYTTIKRTNQKYDYVINSIGTLGGGNHFIEIDIDSENYLWLTVHTGSRNFGLNVAEFHQNQARKFLVDEDNFEYKEQIKIIKSKYKGKKIQKAIDELKTKFGRRKTNNLESLTNQEANLYFTDMEIAQKFAALNRLVIGHIIIEGFYKIPLINRNKIESVHNYIDFNDRIIRKGAISANKGQSVIIPLNMAEGVVIGIGKGDPDWNFSAPHGAGRKYSRSRAKHEISMSDFEKVMKKNNVWSSSVSTNTLDESPQAYKDSATIISEIEQTVEVIDIMKSVYNFKAIE